MPRAGLSTDLVVAEAAVLADEAGYDGLTLTALADRLGVAVPSLYKHVRSLEVLRIGVAVLGLTELGRAMRVAAARAESGTRATTLAAVATAYRAFALAYPGRYEATIRAAGPTHPELDAAGDEALRTSFAVLRDIGLSGDELVHGARALRASLHGFVALESAGSFGLPQDIDRSFERMVEALERGLDQEAGRGPKGHRRAG